MGIIAKGYIAEAIKQTQQFSLSKEQKNAIIQLSGEYQTLQREKMNGVISIEEERLALNRINNRILLIIEMQEDEKRLLPPKIKWWQILTGLAVIIGILGGIAEFSGWNLREIFGGGSKPETFTVTVFVHGKKGKDERILKNQGQVMLGLRTNEMACSINEKGEATFKEIPIGFKGQKVGFRIDHPQPYRCTHPDSLYLLEPNAAIYVEVALEGTNKIFGKVMDFQTEKWLDSVRVSIENIVTFTDKYGWFELNIPENKQRKFQKVTFDKKGYKNETLDSVPVHTQKEILFSLHKASKK